MEVNDCGDEKQDDGDTDSMPHLGEEETRAVEEAMTKHGIGSWRRAQRVAAMALMRSKSRNVFDVIRCGGPCVLCNDS
jgi:hypothetical protein